MILALLMALNLSTALLQERFLYGQLAKSDLITFSRLTSPVPGDPLNVRVSKFDVRPHHELIAEALHRVKLGFLKRLEIELPPRHGKSEISVRKFVPWFAGNFPDKSLIVVTHTQTLANDHGRDCRGIFRGAGYRTAFSNPRCQLREDSQAMDRLQLVGGGVIHFSGRGGLGAGVGADGMLFDDFFKNSEEAQSLVTREEAWRTYISDCQSRLNDEKAWVVMIGSRRNEDDVQGRLFDPTNLNYDEGEAKQWLRIRLPALAEQDDPLGRKKDEALWPEKFSAVHYIKRRNHKSDIVREDHQTQDQCNPTPAEGNYFKKKWLKTYDLPELPDIRNLRIYVASDHAVRKEQKNDRNCLLVVGIDPADVIYVLPTTFWERCETDVLVDEMMKIVIGMKPSQWGAAKDQISGSIGPFWRLRMKEQHAYVVVEEFTESRELIARAQSFRGRCAMGMVRWPRFAPFWGEMEKELLAFPNGKHDDVVAAGGILGMMLDRLVAGTGNKPNNAPRKGTFAWHSFGQDKGPTAKGWT